MKLTQLALAAVGSAALLLASPAHAQTGTITQWNFDNLSTTTNALDFNPATSTGTGTATSLGMTNTYTVPGTSVTSTDDSGIKNGSVAPDTGNVWRIVGTKATSGSGSSNVNGWNSAAPIATQGASFLISTVGYSSLSFNFDVDITNQGEANLAVLYTTNGGSTWTDLPAVDFTTLTSGVAGTGTLLAETNSSNSNIITGGYLSATGQSINSTDTWFQDITANLSGISGANNDAGFGIEIVNAATGTADTALAGTALNNTSGNWRFDNVTLVGQAVPEPNSLILGLGAVALFLGLRRVRRS
jgi:hypothetical protein